MTRSRVRPINYSACNISGIATAVAIGWVSCFATSAFAQESTALRGSVASGESGMTPLPTSRPRFAERSTELPPTTSAPR